MEQQASDLNSRNKSSFHAALLEQEHRFVRIVLNCFQHGWHSDTAIKTAVWRALIWKIFSPTTFVAMGFSIAGVVGIFLAIEANRLLQTQNELLDVQNQRVIQQNILMEAERRSSIGYELTEILNRLSGDIRDHEFQTGLDWVSARKVPSEVNSRIVSFTLSALPYRVMNDEGEISGLKSPERSQLLRALVSQRYDISSICKQAGVFSFSDIKDIRIISYGRVVGSDKEYKGVEFLNLSHSDLTGAEIAYTPFERCLLDRVVFDKASIREVGFFECNMVAGSFLDARIEDSSFSGCLMPSAYVFKSSVISGVNLDGALVRDRQWLEEFSQVIDESRSRFDLNDWVIVKYRKTEDDFWWEHSQDVTRLWSESIFQDLGSFPWVIRRKASSSG